MSTASLGIAGHGDGSTLRTWLADLLLFGLLSLVAHITLYLFLQRPEPAFQPARPRIVELSLVAPPPVVPVDLPSPPAAAAPPPPPPVAKARPAPRPRPRPAPVVASPPPVPVPPPAPAPTSAPAVAPAPALDPAVQARAPVAAQVAALVPAHTRATSLTNPKPDYPAIARRRGWEGRVVIRLHVLANGMPDSVAVVDSSGREMFDESALRALKRWVFTPATRDGVPEASTVTIPVVFKLDD